jgi:polyribonucleotide 5'-hydroxyl-kinase
MSLPGLDLTQPSAEREFVAAPPSQINLSPGSEWRFEVAHGTTVRVKVSSACLSSIKIIIVVFCFVPAEQD